VFEKLSAILHFENFVSILLLFAVSFLTYKFRMQNASNERKALIEEQILKSLRWCGGTFALLVLWRGTKFLRQLPIWIEYTHSPSLEIDPEVFLAWIGFLVLFISFIWAAGVLRLLSFVGFFVLNKKKPVPLVLINVVTFLLAALMALSILKIVFGVSITPLLATSAVLSLVLGLALQDTLGNLLTGIALQLDKPFRIGDWIELQGPGLKAVGQVKEMTWRATLLVSFTDEHLVFPNRLVAQSQISNFSPKKSSVMRGQMLRLPLDQDFDAVERVLVDAVSKIQGLCADPKPRLLLVDNGDSWINCKLVYWVVDFGQSPLLADEVLRVVHSCLKQSGVQIAVPGFRVLTI
jgi:small-conductance mechanosensitive channel